MEIVEVFIFVIGAVIGSYLNVLIYRLPRRIDSIFTRSRCAFCGCKIRWYHNIPILSFIFLKGRCAKCGYNISLIYPFVELVTACAFLYFYRCYGLSIYFVENSTLFSMLTVLAFIDAKFYVLPDKITKPGIVTGILFSFIKGEEYILPSLLGLSVGGGILYILAKSWQLLRGQEGMGLGDVKMMGMVGAFIGVNRLIYVMLIASLLGLIFSLLSFIIWKRPINKPLPFGVFISTATIVEIISICLRNG